MGYIGGGWQSLRIFSSGLGMETVGRESLKSSCFEGGGWDT